ncbi:dihydrofolate reductase family protein [Flindersiella endophytica]
MTNPGTNTETNRKVIAHISMSIDGYVSEPDDGMAWIQEHAVSTHSAAYLEGIWRNVSTLLLGRKNYEGFHGFWPQVAKDPDIGWFPPDSAPRHRDCAIWMDEVEKVVFSRTLRTAEWSNARIAQRELEEEVRALKTAPGRDIMVLNSVSIIRALLNAGLVDEFRLAVIPVILGPGGRKLFDDDVHPSKWRVDGVTTFPTGAVAFQYVRKG